MTAGNTVAALIRRTSTGKDAYNIDVYTETASIMRGIFSPGGSVESRDSEEQIVTQPTLSLPTGTNASAVDAVIPQVTVDDSGQPVLDGNGLPQGDRYDIDGDVQAWPPNPYSQWQAQFSVDLKLKRQTG